MSTPPPTLSGQSALPRPPALALFDLDGTLIDSVADIAAAVNATLGSLGREPWPEKQIRAWVGNGADRLLHRALTGDADGRADDALYLDAKAVFGEQYGRFNGVRSAPYPGAREALDWLAANGCLLACVTNKPERFIEPLLAAFDLYAPFAFAIGGDTLAQKKPDALPLLSAAERAGSSAAQTLMVGDSVTDLRAARAAGCPCVCVSYGYNYGRPIADGWLDGDTHIVPDAVVDSLAELPRLLAPL